MSRPSRPPSSLVTPQQVWTRRREFLHLGAAGALGLVAAPQAAWALKGAALTVAARKQMAGGEDLTPYKDITSYNNFYEFGTGKLDPALAAGVMKTRPWTVVVDGEVHKPQTVDMDALLRIFPLEERIYRMRCVEAWSMVVPWVGFPLAALLNKAQPTSHGSFVTFSTLHDPLRMPGQRSKVMAWPYREALRLDEAMHPLTLLAVGLYGRVLPNQNGAPLRLVVPWKYGFKSIKSIVRISVTRAQPTTTWNQMAPKEYGFLGNVNPGVAHPRWSQAKERRIGEFFRRKTLPFNGYADQVAHMYTGVDLAKNF